MMKVYKAVHERENKCKELHKEMNMNVGPTRLVQPDFYLLVDVDDLQKQVNTLENEVHHMKRAEARGEMALWKKKSLRLCNCRRRNYFYGPAQLGRWYREE